jgi:uncharacterized protein YcbK (DUF882 family)
VSTLPVSQFFTPAEFACRDGTWYPEEWAGRWALLTGLCDAIRRMYGAPLTVVSGYRTQEYNDSLLASGHHPAANSQHIEGMAADLAPGHIEGRDPVGELHAMVLRAYEVGQLPDLGGLGIYPDWIHCDTFKAPDGHLRRWSTR